MNVKVDKKEVYEFNRNLYNQIRIREIDVIRGICIVLMVIDHFLLFYFNLINFNINENINFQFKSLILTYLQHPARNVMRIIVVNTFFIISGISSTFSHNLRKRFIKLAIAAWFVTFITYLITALSLYNCLVICGVIHCYAIFVGIHCLIQFILKKCKANISNLAIFNIALLFCLIAIVMEIIDYKFEGSNIFIYLGIPSKDYVAPLEYAPPTKYAWAYVWGILFGKIFYLHDKHSRLKLEFPILSYIGRYGVYAYFLHFPIIISIILFM